MKRISLIGLFALLSNPLLASVTLPALVGDNMVLQRDARINLWGWADPEERVEIQFQGKQLRTKAGKDGKWKLVLPAFPAGGPYEMVIKGNTTITLRNILLGDVWLASGQSNMEWPVNAINNSKQELQSADYPQIRLFKVKKKYSFQPKEQPITDGWLVCTPKTVDDFSAVAFLFGRELHQRYSVPVGLIQSAWGGTPAETWTSARGLKPFPDLANRADHLAGIDSATIVAFTAKKDAWYKQYGKIDRGHSASGLSWAEADISTADWSRFRQPGLWSNTSELKGFTGIIWQRKEFNVPADASGKPIELSLGRIILMDSVFFNGKFIGRSTGYTNDQFYQVPGDLVKAGKNVLVLRIVGNNYLNGGMVSPASDLYAQAGTNRIPLAGDWLYKTGTDISGLPYDSVLSGFNAGLPSTPTILFNAMIAPLTSYTIKGTIWYQGETNADDTEEALRYYALFPALITDWRKQWGYDFPFLFVQLAGYQPNRSTPSDYVWANLREAQVKALSLTHTGMATAIDIGEETNIHPKNKQDVAHRLALVAEKVAYMEQVVYSGPTFKNMRVEGDKVYLSFDNIGSGLWVKDTNSLTRCFAIAGADKTFVWAKVVQVGNELLVSAEGVRQPVAIRYNWINTPQGNFYNKENLPAVPFRTDDW